MGGHRSRGCRCGARKECSGSAGHWRAAALVAGGHVADLQQGAKMAKASIVSGKALAALDGLIAITNGKA